MLRRLIKSLIPSKGDIFFKLFEEQALIANEAAKLLVDMLNAKDEQEVDLIYFNSRSLKQKADETNRKVITALDHMFITPIDRGDIQELAGLLSKLTKRIVKISSKLRIYHIDTNTDDCMIKNADTLLSITQILTTALQDLKLENAKNILTSQEQIQELEENGIEDLRHAIDEMFSGKFDILTILKLKEVYKSIDSAIEAGLQATDIIVQISLKNV
jgi:hypothetical protein